MPTPSRRSFLAALGSLPLLGFLKDVGAATAGPVIPPAPPPETPLENFRAIEAMQKPVPALTPRPIVTGKPLWVNIRYQDGRTTWRIERRELSVRSFSGRGDYEAWGPISIVRDEWGFGPVPPVLDGFVRVQWEAEMVAGTNSRFSTEDRSNGLSASRHLPDEPRMYLESYFRAERDYEDRCAEAERKWREENHEALAEIESRRESDEDDYPIDD